MSCDSMHADEEADNAIEAGYHCVICRPLTGREAPTKLLAIAPPSHWSAGQEVPTTPTRDALLHLEGSTTTTVTTTVTTTITTTATTTDCDGIKLEKQLQLQQEQLQQHQLELQQQKLFIRSEYNIDGVDLSREGHQTLKSLISRITEKRRTRRGPKVVLYSSLVLTST